MPIISTHVTLSGTRSIIAQADNMPQSVTIHNEDAAQNTTAFIGSDSVTVGTGLHINSGGTIQLTLRPGDVLYGISDGTSPVLSMLAIQMND